MLLTLSPLNLASNESRLHANPALLSDWRPKSLLPYLMRFEEHVPHRVRASGFVKFLILSFCPFVLRRNRFLYLTSHSRLHVHVVIGAPGLFEYVDRGLW